METTPLVDKIIYCANEVYNELGIGFSKEIYKEALFYEMDLMKLNVEEDKEIFIKYKNIKLDIPVYIDFVVEKNVLVFFEHLEKKLHKSKVLTIMKNVEIKNSIIIDFNSNNEERMIEYIRNENFKV